MGDSALSITTPRILLATPRSLPKPATLGQRVVVLDIAFASSAGSASGPGDATAQPGASARGQSFETLTLPFIDGLGPRLVCWIDHHDSMHHARFAADPRFVLRTKAEHPACPELVTPQRVEAAGEVDTLICHGDFDGLASAAKWLRGGHACYPDCDADARAIDSRIGVASTTAIRIDRALRGAPRDVALRLTIIQHLRHGARDPAHWQQIDAAGEICAALETQSARMAADFRPAGPDSVWLEVPPHSAPYDKTALLLAGQQQARIALVVDGETLTLAAPFDSGVNFLAWFALSGGMPTVLSLRRERLPEVLARLAARTSDRTERA